jgi:hypothetical protein
MKRPINKGDLPADWKPSARVKITEKAPLLQHLTKDPADSSRLLLKYIHKDLKRREASRRGAQKTNEDQWERTNRQKRIFRNIIEPLIKKDSSLGLFGLRGKQTKLVRDAQAEWPKYDKAPAFHTLRHWFADMYPKK